MATKTKKHKELPNTHVPFKFKKHILPPVGGLLIALLVFGFFNSQYLSGRIAYAIKQRQPVTSTPTPPPDNGTTIDPASYTIDKNAPKVIAINKINVTAPVIYNQTTVNEAAFQRALRDGVVHYPNTALPGQPGNVVIFGHSSGQWWAPGNYKFVFSLLDQLVYGDTVTIDYDGTHYSYMVTNKSVVLPDDIGVLAQDAKQHTLTLITCTPVGTNKKRLIVEAKQIIPQTTIPATKPADKPLETTKNAELPSPAPSFWDSFTSLFSR